MKYTDEMKKKEFEKIKQYFKERNYELLSNEFINGTNKIYYICPKHRDKGILTTTWNRCKSKGSGCRFCANEYVNSLKRINEDTIKQITEEKGFIYDHVEYENRKCIIYFYCKIHYGKGLQRKRLNDMKKSNGQCNYCNGRARTDEDFKNDMIKLHPNIGILSKYKNSTSDLKCKCKVCNNEWTSNANLLYSQKYGCSVCAIKSIWANRMKTKESFQKELDLKYNGKITLLSEYVNSHDKIKCRCNIDNTIWWQTPTSLLTGKIGCPTCCGNQIRERCKKSNEDFISQLNIANPNLIPLEEYIDDHTKILCTCKIHSNYKWYVTPNKILHKNTGCPLCSKSVSSNEIKIQNILQKWGYKFETQKRFKDCRDKNPLPFDIYLSDFNILIEYDGEQHYKNIDRSRNKNNNLEITQKHDLIKTKYCKMNNIPLIRIPYWKQDDLEYFLFEELVKNNAIEKIA